MKGKLNGEKEAKEQHKRSSIWRVMNDIKDPITAREFLRENGYQLTTENAEGSQFPVTYRDGTGNGSWEGDFDTPGVAYQNEWMRKEKTTCCFENEALLTDPNYCGDCGGGIKVNVSWCRSNDIKDKDYIEKGEEIDFAEFLTGDQA